MEVVESPSEPDEGTDDLDAVVAVAVAEGLDAVDRLSGQVMAVLDRCIKAAAKVESDHDDLPGSDIVVAYGGLITAQKAEAEDRFTRQRTRLSTFNLVLFGRTGAGKSSLIEALSSGDGRAISQGESDWTTDVRDVTWRSSRLVDTPGIAGWGRTVDRAALEARAEVAVADADIVILCFDTQSQQDGEFSKVAEWVSRYGKPVVAVLNSRNAHWRQPVKARTESRRRALSQSVHEHAGNIRDELAQIGLLDVPIVAIHTERASFARTTDPYAGPFLVPRQKQRDEFGAERLLAWSNLPALELLLSQSLARHATPLRLSMLHEQARGLLLDAEALAQVQHDEAVVLAEQLERGIADVLRLIGRPADKALARRITRLEKLRGGFGAADNGELLGHTRFRLAAELRQARSKALLDADRMIDTAFGTKTDVEPEDFEQAVLAPARTAAEAVARVVGAELQRYLADRLALVAEDVQADLRAAIGSFEGADANAGRTGRILGITLESGSGILGIGSGIAFLLLSNPTGWAILAVSAVSVAGGFAFSYVGGKVRRRAAANRIGTWSEARARGRRAVHDTFDRLERAICEDIHRMLAQAAHERLADDVARATALRRVARAGQNAVLELEKVIGDLPEVAESSHLLSEVARDLQRRRHPGEPTAERLLWLGESWCTDPEGLIEDFAEAPAIQQTHDASDAERVLTGIRTVTDAAALVPAEGSGVDWITSALGDLAGDSVALDALAPLRDLADGAPPRIVLAGDYSTGKSSFIKRLLVDSDLGVPENLEVAAQPKTDASHTFCWGSWEIVDTPGFQSSHREHTAAAHEAVIGASLLIVLFNPNLVLGSAADLLRVLHGDLATGRVGKAARTLFIINRADELGIDPEEDLAGYHNLCRRKELELAQALGALQRNSSGGHSVIDAEQILSVASDPYGLVGDRYDADRTDYDRHRHWDGMDSLGQGLATMSTALGRNSADVRILEGGAVILGNLVAERQRRLADIEGVVRQRRLLLLDLDACLNAGRALHAAARDRLATTSVSFVAALLDEAVSTSDDDDQRAARAKRLEVWSSDPEFQQLFREWCARFEREQQEWQQATSARVEARLTSSAFTSAFPGNDTSIDVDHLMPDADARARDKVVAGAQAAAGAASRASREGVTKFAHAFGHKFRPWGATKLTTKVNKAGGALGIALGAVELYGVYRSVLRENDGELSASERRTTILREVRDKTESYFDRNEPDAPGFLMAEAIEEIQRVRNDEAARLQDIEAEAADLANQVDRCDRQVHDALRRLETPEP